MQEEADQLYRRPQMTGQAREEEEEEYNESVHRKEQLVSGINTIPFLKCRLYSLLLLRSEGFNAISPTERKSRQWLSDSVYFHRRQWVWTHLGGRTWLTSLAVQLVRWLVSLLTVGILNVFCWAPNYTK